MQQTNASQLKLTSAPSIPVHTLLCAFSFLAGLVALNQSSLIAGSEPWFNTFAGIELLAIILFSAVTTALIERTIIHPYIFLQGTLALFIGGRFLASPLLDAPIFTDNNYIPMELSYSESSHLMSFVCGALLMMHAGYLLIRTLGEKAHITFPKDSAQKGLFIPSLALLLVSAIISIYAITQHYAACMERGYMAIYQDQGTDNLLRLSSIGQYGLLLGAGLAFATSKRWLQILAVSLVTGYYIAYLGVGLRSGFLALVLMATWLAHTRLKRLNILTLIFVPLVMFGLAQLSTTVGCRASGGAAPEKESPAIALEESSPPPATATASNEVFFNNSNPEIENIENFAVAPEKKHTVSSLQRFKENLKLEQLAWFSYLQGSTLVYTGAAMRIDAYPTSAYLQTFFPGYSQVAHMLHPEIASSDFYFPHYLARSYSEEKYEQGFGMGWSIFSDLAAFSKGNTFLYALFSLALGAALAYFIKGIESSAYLYGALVCIFMKLMLLPRSGLYSVIPYLAVYTAIFLGWKLFMHLLHLLRKDRNLTT
ncbi:O-antigen polysaccharide polymerase Wzy [Pseudomonas fluorescens]|uniref:O-antigen polysaccharide polymerase Wzy n=1 Tax=Pseudomonas fluorescens TaxID=294 RepID=UPI003D07DBA9